MTDQLKVGDKIKTGEGGNSDYGVAVIEQVSPSGRLKLVGHPGVQYYAQKTYSGDQVLRYAVYGKRPARSQAPSYLYPVCEGDDLAALEQAAAERKREAELREAQWARCSKLIMKSDGLERKLYKLLGRRSHMPSEAPRLTPEQLDRLDELLDELAALVSESK